MPRQIPVYIIPSHVYLSQEDQVKLFGIGYPMTIAGEHTQSGQYVYNETVEIIGRLKRSLKIRVLGPNWKRSFVEMTPTEVAYLGVRAVEAKIGDIENASPCSLIGSNGSVDIERGIIIPRPHLTCTPEDAEKFGIKNGDEVSFDLIDVPGKVIEKVLVRIHPTFKLCIEIHQDIARDLWITKTCHARFK